MTETAIAIPVEKPPSSPIRDLRAGAMSVPVEVQQVALAEYAERRKSFRDWLRSQLVAGIHFGVPPGCEPKTDARGWIGVWNKRSNAYVYYPPEQWQAKPSLYQAGAHFITDLMGLRPTFDADMDGWAQLGSKPGLFVYKCELYSQTTGELVGEGRGIRMVGQKGGDENNAIKMAKKSALVDAVLTAYGLSDLFTQDLEHSDPPPPPNPSAPQKPDAPKASTRGEKMNAKAAHTSVVDLHQRWSTCSHEPAEQSWAEFCNLATGESFDYRKPAEWAKDNRLQLLVNSVNKLEGGTPPAATQSGLPF